MIEGEADRKAINLSIDTKVQPSITSALENITPNGETENISEVSSPKPRIRVALPQSKYPPITRIDPIEQTPPEESPQSESRTYDDNDQNNITISTTTILETPPPPKPVIESPSTNTIHPPNQNGGIPELIQFNVLMDSPKSLFSDSESSPSQITRNGKITPLDLPSISPNPSKLERKDSRESWMLYTPSELRMSPLSRAQTTPHSNSQYRTTPSLFSPAGERRFWGNNFSQSNSTPHYKAGSAPITPHNFIHRSSAPITPTPHGLFFYERKCSLVENVISPATHELKLFQKGIQTSSPVESPQTPCPESSPASSPSTTTTPTIPDYQSNVPTTPPDCQSNGTTTLDCQSNANKVDGNENNNNSNYNSPYPILPMNNGTTISPHFRNLSPPDIITKGIQPEFDNQQRLEVSPSKSFAKVPLLELGPKEKSICCCLIS